MIKDSYQAKSHIHRGGRGLQDLVADEDSADGDSVAPAVVEDVDPSLDSPLKPGTSQIFVRNALKVILGRES